MSKTFKRTLGADDGATEIFYFRVSANRDPDGHAVPYSKIVMNSRLHTNLL